MEKKLEEQEQHVEKKPEQDKEGNFEGLPGEVKDSPYLKYEDLEDYKRKGYGTEAHLEPKPGRGAGGTDAPTPSGGASATATDNIN